MVYRVYAEKKQGLTAEADALKHDVVNLLGIENLTDLRLLNRYDVENIEKELFEYCKTTVFSEPQLDHVYGELPKEEAVVFAVEYLPGQIFHRKYNGLLFGQLSIYMIQLRFRKNRGLAVFK